MATKTTTSSAARSASAPNPNRRALSIIFFVMLMDVIGLSIIFPVAPFIVQRYSQDALMVTMLTVIYAAAQFFAAPWLGKLSDRVGRRPVLLASVFGSAIGYIILGVGGALWILFLSRLIDGVSGGNLSTASAYIADISTPEERPKNFALIGMAFGFGFILGPALGGVLSKISIDAPAYAAALLAGVSVIAIYFLLPESLAKEHREHSPIRLSDLNPMGAIGTIARKPGMGILLVVGCLFNLAFSGVNAVVTIYIVHKFMATPWQIGILLVTAGVTMAVMQALLVAKTVARFGNKRMAIFSLVGQAIFTCLTVFLPAFWLLYPLNILNAAVRGFIWGTLGTLSANLVQPREQGTLAGVNTALASLMSVFGPLGAGAIYDYVHPSSPFWIGTLVLVAAALLMLSVKQSTPVVAQAGWH